MTVSSTPGVSIRERDAFAASVVEPPSAVTAFIGYTASADSNGLPLHNVPTRVTSMREFEALFGGAPVGTVTRFSMAPLAGAPAAPTTQPLSARDAVPVTIAGVPYLLAQTHGFYLLHASLRLFFANGGGVCVVVSVGTYSDDAGVQVQAAALLAGLAALEHDAAPTLVVIPETVLLSPAECQRVQSAMLRHCDAAGRNRFAILDIRDGYRERSVTPDCVTAFRDGIDLPHRRSGAAYYPWVNASLSRPKESPLMLLAEESLDALAAAIEEDVRASIANAANRAAALARAATIRTVDRSDARAVRDLDAALRAVSGAYDGLSIELTRRLGLLPAAAAVAGVYSGTDAARGVWTAPASVALNDVLSPAVPLDDAAQADIRLAPNGTSVNVIRHFPNRGTVLWGARTLDGFSNEWRYVSVRRSVRLIEASIRGALAAFVFEPNDANTWATVRAMITNYLSASWRQGMFAGSTVDQAFAVKVGLGETMTDDDVSQGRLRVLVLVALVRPAEFIALTIDMQLSRT